jgi:alkyldihydroxyacetonephosphate synthase
MRLERLPEVRRFRSFLFPNLAAGMEAGRRIMLDRLQPLVIRLYDERSTIRTVKHVLGTEVTEGAYMVLGFDGFADIVAAQERRAYAICAALGARDLGEEAGRRWWENRYNFYFPPKAPDLPWMFGTLDTVTTFDRMEALVAAKKAALEEGFAGHRLYYYAHFSHWFPWGVMVYDRFVIEQPPEDPDEALLLHDRVWDLATRISLEHGGVINEHHGVGLKLARHVRRQFGAGFRVIEAIKDGLDPDHLFNPGKMGFGPPR